MKRILVTVLGLLFAARLIAQTNTVPARLAIVGDSPDAAPIVDVLTAEFSKDDRVQLLERAEIEKIIQEQQLSLNNLDGIKLGRLLGADGVLFLASSETVESSPTEMSKTNRFLDVRLVAVKPGVVLAAERFTSPENDLTGWASQYVGHLGPYVDKLGVLPQDAIPLSVVNFHAGVRTTEAAGLERQILFLTVERLVREKRLFVLERNRMQALSGEKELSSVEGEPFWNGKYLLDGAIDRDGFNPEVMTISARLIPPGGSPVLIEASGGRTNSLEAVNRLAEQVLAALRLETNPVAWNPAEEADKFYKEAQWNLSWKIFPQARESAEAAWALGKQDTDCMKLRVRTYMPPPDNGVVYFPPREKPDSDKIDDAIQAAQLYRDFSRNLPPDEPKPDSDWYKLGLENLTIATRVLQQFNWSPDFYLPVSDKLAELRVQSRAMAELLSRAPSVHDSYFVGNRKVKYDDLYHFMEQPSIYGLKVHGGCLWQEKPEDELALYRELMASPVFCYVHGQFWFRDGDHSITRLQAPPRLVAWNDADQKRLPDLWQRFLAELKGSPDVSRQMEARALRLADVSFDQMLGGGRFDTRAGFEAAYRAEYQRYSEELSAAFTDFLDAFVTNRIYFKTNNVDLLYLNWGVDDLVERMGGSIATDIKDSLQKQYRTEYAAKLTAKDNELAQAVAASEKLDAFAAQIKFLQDRQPYDPSTFVQRFIFGFKDYSPEQARTIQPLLAEYKKQLSGTWAQIGQMQVGQVEAGVEHILNPEVVVPPLPSRVVITNGHLMGPASAGNFQPPPPPRPLGPDRPGIPQPNVPHQYSPDREVQPVADTPAPEPVVSSNIVTVKNFYPLPANGLPGDKPDAFRITDHQLIDGGVLLDFQYNAWFYSFDQNGNWQSSADKTRSGVALFDPLSGRWQVAVLPGFVTFETGTKFLHHSTVWHGALYTSDNGRIQKYDWQKSTWDTNALPVSGNYQLFNLAGKLYVADYDSIQQITDDARGTRLLASIQRQPAVTRLDSQGALMDLALFLDAKKSLCAAVHNKIFRWDGADWQEVGAVSASFEPSVFDGGVLFLTDGWNTRPARISCLNAGSTNVELCLRSSDRERINASSPDVSGGMKPLWKLPAGLSLPNLSAACGQTDIFLMTDHSEKQNILTEERGTRPDGTTEVSHIITGEKFLPKDGYDSALFCFSRGRPAAEKVLLKFDDPEGAPPMAGLGSNSQPLIPQIGITRSWMLFTPKFLLCGRERIGDGPGSSEPAGFKPGIWVVPLEQIEKEIDRQKQLQAGQLARDLAAKKSAAKAMLDLFDWNHDGVIDGEEKEAALTNEDYIASQLDAIDTNQNGVLDASELKFFDANTNNILDPNEQAGIEITQRLLAERLVRKFDADGNGLLNWQEFDNLKQNTFDQRFQPMMGSPFPDENHDGSIDVEELKDFLESRTENEVERTTGTHWVMGGIQTATQRTQRFKQDLENFWQGGSRRPRPFGPGSIPPFMQPPSQLQPRPQTSQ